MSDTHVFVDLSANASCLFLAICSLRSSYLVQLPGRRVLVSAVNVFGEGRNMMTLLKPSSVLVWVYLVIALCTLGE